MRKGRSKAWVLAVAIAFAALGSGGGAAAASEPAGIPAAPAPAIGPAALSPLIPSAALAALNPAALSPWRGGMDLYRPGVFTTQRTWLWCTAADIQISRNIVFRRADHTTAGQQAYFAWMRAHNRYSLPLSAGVDAAGWAAGFRHFVDGRYQLVASTTFDAALRSAVTRLRLTSLPVGITVDHGNHAWLITGFTATADPATTARFTITSVRVVGPLYGLQSRNGYDMPPDTRLTPAQLRRFFTPWRYVPKRMVWDGRYISIQPVPAAAAPAAAASAASPSAGATALAPSSAPSLQTSPAVTPGSASGSSPATGPAPVSTPPAQAATTRAASSAGTPAPGALSTAQPAPAAGASTTAPVEGTLLVPAALVAVGATGATVFALRRRNGHGPR